MSSEEMRAELELFVNRGLREGWQGWPRHESRGLPRRIGTDGTGRTRGTHLRGGCSYRSYRSYMSYMTNFN